MIKQSPPTLEQRFVNILANTNAGSEALAELIVEVEATSKVLVETAEAERIMSMDLVQCDDPHAAKERIAAAELAGDRLQSALPKLREKLSTFRHVPVIASGHVAREFVARHGPALHPCPHGQRRGRAF